MADRPPLPTSGYGLSLRRVFDAPPETLWREWTEPERFADWFGGADAEVPLSSVSMDVTPGGRLTLTMYYGPDRTESHWTGEYREVDAPERLVFTISDSSDDRHELVTVVLTDLGDGRTEMQLDQRGHLPPDAYRSAERGWGAFFDRLDEHLAFAPLAEDFLRITAATVFCSATTVDAHGRPRSRMLHPVFTVTGGIPIGWALTGRTPLKTAHLAANPHMSCTYWSPSHDTVFVDCVATWVEEEDERRTAWELFRDTPQPLGWGSEGLAGYGPEEWRAELFTPLRLEPWRVQVVSGDAYPAGDLTGRVWRRR
jgi:uncharacterized protein YndB with AHSA1/START domain